MAYENQGFSLQEVQKFGPELERKVREFLGWTGGQAVRVVYFEDSEKPLKTFLHEKPLKYNLHERPLKYDLQVDSCYPNVDSPEIFVSVTYCNPDKPGHSNENKLHLKIGELMLLKAAFPNIKSVLVIGGNRGTWMPYVLKVFQYFFDETIFMWKDDVRLNHFCGGSKY